MASTTITQHAAAAVAATATCSFTPGQVSHFVSNVYFYDYVTRAGGNDPRGIAILQMTLYRIPDDIRSVDPAPNIYDGFITESTVIKSSFLERGDKLQVEYDNNGVIYQIIVLDEEEEIYPKEPVAEPEIPEAEWVNLCERDMMFHCASRLRARRGECHFFKSSTTRCNDCAHCREEMDHVCDCVAAHIHYKKYQPVADVKTASKEPDKSYDETLKEAFGREV